MWPPRQSRGPSHRHLTGWPRSPGDQHRETRKQKASKQLGTANAAFGQMGIEPAPGKGPPGPAAGQPPALLPAAAPTTKQGQQQGRARAERRAWPHSPEPLGEGFGPWCGSTKGRMRRSQRSLATQPGTADGEAARTQSADEAAAGGRLAAKPEGRSRLGIETG